MLIAMTMDLIGGFRYFQINLHPSNDFCAIGVDWSNFQLHRKFGAFGARAIDVFFDSDLNF